MIIIEIIIETRIESMTHIPDPNKEIQKTLTTHTINTEEDRITENNKLTKIQFIKTRIIFITKRSQKEIV